MKTPDSTHNLRAGLLMALLPAVGSTAKSAESEATLKDTFKDYFRVGTAINRSITTGNAGFRRTAEEVSKDIALVKGQFNQIVPENEMKWKSIHADEEIALRSYLNRLIDLGVFEPDVLSRWQCQSS